MRIEDFIQDAVGKKHPIIAELIHKEDVRQYETIELIASENFPSDAVKAAAASSFVAKYSEGYPVNRTSGNKGRYYGGCENVNELEEYCCDKWREVFKTDYHVNVQPHSGSQANFAAYMAVLQPGDLILSMAMDAGSHLTHASPVSFVSKFYKVATYGLNDDGYIDYDDVAQKARELKPKLILAGASAYSRIIDFEFFGNIAKEVGAYLLVDMAHIAGLIAAGDHPSPFGIADIITTTTHKTLAGIRGGLIFCKPELARKVDSAVFPGSQGGSLQNIIAAKAVTAEEDCTEEYHNYIHNVVRNCKAMANEFVSMGYDVVTGGTDTHLFLIDLSKTHPTLTGKMVQDYLDQHHITLNKNGVPGDKRKPMETSGVRIGTAAMTRKGYTPENFIAVAHVIDRLIKQISE